MHIVIAYLGLSISTLSILPDPQQLPLPQSGIEVLAPTRRHHTVQAECGDQPSSIEWDFDGGRKASFRKVILFGKPLPTSELVRWNTMASEFGGDFFVAFQCDSSAAKFSIIEMSLAATGAAKKISFDFVDGKMINLKKRNFTN